MKDLLEIISKKPELYEQSPKNMWDDTYISGNMLKAHLDENLDSATRKLEFVKGSVRWISSAYPPDQYPSLLDLGCGPGIYAEFFHSQGYDVSGIDLSRRSVAYAQESARKKYMDIHYRRGDYTKTDLGGPYSLVTLIYCDFGVLPPHSRRQLLASVYTSLRPQGIFLFDVFTPLEYMDVSEYRCWDVCEKGFWREELCLTLHSFYRYDEDRTFLNQYVTVSRKGGTFYNIWEHTFTLEELETDLTEAGFRDIIFYGDMSGKIYDPSSRTVCVSARK